MTAMLALYLKLNLLLALTSMLWLVARTLGLLQLAALDARQQLRLARGLLIGALLLTLAPLLIDSFQPGLLAQWSKTMTGGYGGTYTVVAGTTSTLALIHVKGLRFSIGELCGLLVLAGLLLQAMRVGRLWWQLRALINVATPWKRIAGVHLLLSTDTGTPFTTRALGIRHIVLPTSMLHNLPQLRLALKHELQHLRQRDPEWLLMLELAKLVCWWNPVVHWWHLEYDRLHELACDEALVLERRVDSRNYGNCLLDVAETATVPMLLAASTMVPRANWYGKPHSQLRRRIMKLVAMKNDQHRNLKAALYGLLLGSGLMGGTLVVLAADVPAPGPAPWKYRDVVPLLRVNPQYPQEALDRHLVGWVTIQFAITETGTVDDAKVVASCVGETIETCIRNETLFNETSLVALQKWQYQPQIKDGHPYRREGVQTMLKFVLEN
ncbi:MAG TPA: M56 family metallopeptidase [Candidatus Acidoferrum sp.]|nr:M56 family metallopeptidase [Candidatus Acidoferrum sp.]